MKKQDMSFEIYTILLIQNDCETIKKLIMNSHDPIFIRGIIPYLALFCRSVQEYCNITLINEKFDKQIYDIRNSIKMYGERYGKSKKRFIAADEKQDAEFRDMLRFNFTKKINKHFNLGMYFTGNKKVVGNTQLIANIVSFFRLSGKGTKKKACDLGCYLASIVNNVSSGLSGTLPVPEIAIQKAFQSFYYMDLNTNRNNFLNPIFGKDINLFMLHLL